MNTTKKPQAPLLQVQKSFTIFSWGTQLVQMENIWQIRRLFSISTAYLDSKFDVLLEWLQLM